MKLHRAFVALACSAAAVVAAPARAEGGSEPSETVVLTRAQALSRGAERGPFVKEALAPLRATGALRDATGALLSYAPRATAFAGRRTGDFGAGLELGGGVVQELSLRRLGARRSELAAAVERSAHGEVDRARLVSAAVAVLAWIDLLEAQELMRMRTAARTDAEEIARVARSRADRGVATPAEAALAASEVGVAELGERNAEGGLFEARAGLKFAVGLPPPSSVAAHGELRDFDAAPPAVAASPREHPFEAAARNRIELTRAETRLVHAAGTPTLGAGVSLSREGTGEVAVTGMITLPLPVLDPARFESARTLVTAAGAEGQAERVRAELGRDVAIAEHDRQHTREVHETLAVRVLVPLRETVRLARAAYQAGTQDVTTFLLIRQRLVASEEQLARASADVLRADVQYELARGTLLARWRP